MQTNYQEKLDEKVEETVESIMGFAESLMVEYLSNRLSKREYELGFNLKIAICIYYGKTIDMRQFNE